jgi:hypothetical protein
MPLIGLTYSSGTLASGVKLCDEPFSRLIDASCSASGVPVLVEVPVMFPASPGDNLFSSVFKAIAEYGLGLNEAKQNPDMEVLDKKAKISERVRVRALLEQFYT